MADAAHSVKGIESTREELRRALCAVRALLSERHLNILKTIGIELGDATEPSPLLANPTDVVVEFCRKLSVVLEEGSRDFGSVLYSKTVHSDWMPLLHSLFYCSLALLVLPRPHADEPFNTSSVVPPSPTDTSTVLPSIKPVLNAILQRFFPLAGQLWLLFNEAGVSQEFIPGSEGDWLRLAWSLLTHPSHLTDDDHYALVVPVLARLLKMYLPWSDATTVNSRVFERGEFDIRSESAFLSLLQAGLLSTAGAVRKQALFITKQAVKFSTLYMQPPLESKRHYDLFIWRPVDRAAWGELWRKFFLLYEAIHETQVHIVEPLLPYLSMLLPKEDGSKVSLPFAWWEIIVKRAFLADSAAVRKRIIETVLSADLLPKKSNNNSGSDDKARENNNLEAQEMKRESKVQVSNDQLESASPLMAQFVMTDLLKALDNTSLYTNPEAPSQVSSFGLRVASFYAALLQTSAVSVRSFLEAVKGNMRSATPCLFLIQALLADDLHFDGSKDAASRLPLGREEVELMKVFSRNTSLFHNIKARRLVRWQLLQIFLRWADPDRLNFEDIAGVLTELLRERAERLTIESPEHAQVTTWFKKSFSDGYIEGSMALAVQQYFSSLSQSHPSVGLLKRRSEEMATMLGFSLGASFSQAVRPLYQHMALMAEKVETSPEYIVAALCLFSQLNLTVRNVSKGQTDLLANMDVTERLYEWIVLIEKLLLPENSGIDDDPETPRSDLPDLSSIEVLLEGLTMFLCKAQEQKDTLLAYLDILLYRLIELLEIFAQARDKEAAEPYSLQLRKMITLSLMELATRRLESLCQDGGSSHHLFDQRLLGLVTECELERPPGLTDSQAEEWSSLLAAFSSARWRLVATMARFSRSRQDDRHRRFMDLQLVFRQALDALEAAHYRPVLSVLDCMRTLLSLPPVWDDDTQEYYYEIAEVDLRDALSIVQRLLEEASTTPGWFYLYIEAFINCFVQVTLFERNDLLEGELLPDILNYLHRVGGSRRNVMALVAHNLYSIWRSPRGRPSLIRLQGHFVQMLLWGPMREETEDRLASALTLRNHQAGPKEERWATVEQLSLGSDYLVRVHMNSLLLHLDRTSEADCHLAYDVLNDLISLSLMTQ